MSYKFKKLLIFGRLFCRSHRGFFFFFISTKARAYRHLFSGFSPLKLYFCREMLLGRARGREDRKVQRKVEIALYSRIGAVSRERGNCTAHSRAS